jgi:hypothetical protein
LTLREIRSLHESGHYRLAAGIKPSNTGQDIYYITLTPLREDLPPHLYITEKRTVYRFVKSLLL